MPGVDPRQMKRLMKQMKQETLEGVTEVIIRFSDREIVIPHAEVTRIQMGQEIYQVSGAGEERPLSADGSSGVANAEIPPEEVEVKPADVKVLVKKTGATKEAATDALKNNQGDLVRALLSLRKTK